VSEKRVHPKDRRLGSVEAKGAGSTLDFPAAPPNSPSPHGGNHDFCTNNPIKNTTLIHDAVTTITAVLNKLRNFTLVPTHGCEDLLPVPVDAYDRPTLHDLYDKNGKNIAGKNNMATMHDNDVDDDSTKLSQANPLLGQVLVTRPTMSSDVTADNRPKQPLVFKAARDCFDGNASNVVVTNVQNGTLVAAKPVYVDTPDLGRTAQWIADSQSTPPPPNPTRVRYASGSSSSDSSLSPPVLTPHQLGSQLQPRRKPPSSRSSHRSSVSRQSIDLLALTNRLADTADSAIQMQQHLLDAQQSQTQLLLDAQQRQSQQLLQAQKYQSQQQMTQSQHLLEAQQLQSRQQAEAQQIQLEVQKQQLDSGLALVIMPLGATGGTLDKGRSTDISSSTIIRWCLLPTEVSFGELCPNVAEVLRPTKLCVTVVELFLLIAVTVGPFFGPSCISVVQHYRCCRA